MAHATGLEVRGIQLPAVGQESRVIGGCAAKQELNGVFRLFIAEMLGAEHGVIAHQRAQASRS